MGPGCPGGAMFSHPLSHSLALNYKGFHPSVKAGAALPPRFRARHPLDINFHQTKEKARSKAGFFLSGEPFDLPSKEEGSSEAPVHVGLAGLRFAQHRQERRDALRQARRHFVVRVVGFVLVEMAGVLGALLLRLRDRAFQLGDRVVQFVVRDHTALAQLLADETQHIHGEILQHVEILCRLALERNHDNSLFILLCLRGAVGERRQTGVRPRGRGPPERHISTC
ncbi:hypothetical protein BCEN4_250008 [Burkholderia cenocepacia]|nr:hypothetical protein BCEN4_250008 [Burkholderia cenocepacia]